MATERRLTPPSERQIAMGEAIRALRERAGMTQQDAADAFGVTRQAWQNYENGSRSTIMRTDMQERIAEALEITGADLQRELARQAGQAAPGTQGVAESAQVFELPVLGRVRTGPDGPQLYETEEPEGFLDVAWMFGPNARTLRQAGDAMSGYVESGQMVIYDTSRWPRRGDGCVVELTSGELHVSEYVESAQGVLKVRQRHPDEARHFPMSEVKGVYLIRFRGG